MEQNKNESENEYAKIKEQMRNMRRAKRELDWEETKDDFKQIWKYAKWLFIIAFVVLILCAIVLAISLVCINMGI